MSPSTLLASFVARNVVLTAVDGHLDYAAPKGVLTPDDLETLRRRKADLVEYLSSNPSSPVKDEGPSACTPTPTPWRSTVARWPIEFRQLWGDRANALQDQGQAWHEAERRAFEDFRDDAPAAGGWVPRSPGDGTSEPSWLEDQGLTISPAEARGSIGQIAVTPARESPDQPAGRGRVGDRSGPKYDGLLRGIGRMGASPA